MKSSKVQTNLIPVDTEEARKRAEKDLKALIPAANSLPKVINNEAQSQLVSGMMTRVATVKKSVTAEEKSITKLLDAAKKGIKKLFLPMHEELDRIRDECDEKVLDYSDRLEAKAEAERIRERDRENRRLAALERNKQRKIDEAKSKEEAARIKAAYRDKAGAVRDESSAVLNQIVEEKPQMHGASIVKRWQVEVTEWAEVPEEFIIMRLDEKRALEFCRQQAESGKVPSLPGMRFFQKKGTAARGMN